jgi:Rrf2 family nitric oxide-sensitive transcriptional repressor
MIVDFRRCIFYASYGYEIMRLTMFTDYAFRLLIQAAANEPELITITKAAESYGISRNHLTKIANELVRGGYLSAVRGRNGGLRLAKPPAEINVAEVVRHCETDTPLVECFNHVTNKCVITPVCALKSALFAAEAAFYSTLATYTLADITANRAALKQILG